jgi:epoxyqueuosine reductase
MTEIQQLFWRYALTLKEELKLYAEERLEMDYFGVANVERFAGAPEGQRPTDLLPGAKSVIVMAVKLSEGVVQTVFRTHEDGLRSSMCIYGAYGYSIFPNYNLMYAAYSAARFLEKRGHMATPVPSGPGAAGVPFSNRHAAVAAGIGSFGWHGLLMTPDYGPRNRIVSVITRAELEPDPVIPTPKACNPKTCGICIKVCPTHAITAANTKSCSIGGVDYTYTNLNWNACQMGTEGLTKANRALNDYPLPDHEITKEDLDDARQKMDPRQKYEMIAWTAAYHCGKCLAYCPIGRKDWNKTVSKLEVKDMGK